MALCIVLPVPAAWSCAMVTTCIPAGMEWDCRPHDPVVPVVEPVEGAPHVEAVEVAPLLITLCFRFN